jgi:hypothetical protein
MKTLKNLIAALPLLALLLAGCTGPGPIVTLDTTPFVALAKLSPCAGTGNRLFVIDQKYVYWDRDLTCQDQTLRLYGRTTDERLCLYTNAISSCTDATVRGLFETILKNRLVEGLGLGPSHIVVQVNVQAPDDVNLAYRTIAKEAFSGIHARRTVVVRDAATWIALWAEHAGFRTPMPVVPPVDFSKFELVAVFAGDVKGCHELDIRRVNLVSGKVLVDFEDRDITPFSFCIAAITNPVHVVAIPKVEADAQFRQITPVRLEFNTVDRSAYSGVQEPQAVLVKDMAGFRQFWSLHAGPTAVVPPIDFSTSMVIGVFRGSLPNGCYSTEITDVYRIGNVVNVHRVDTEPGLNAICTLAIVTPVHLVVIPRTDDPIVFSAEVRKVP